MSGQDEEPKNVPRAPDDPENADTPKREADDEASHEDFDVENDPAYNPEDERFKGIKGG